MDSHHNPIAVKQKLKQRNKITEQTTIETFDTAFLRDENKISTAKTVHKNRFRHLQHLLEENGKLCGEQSEREMKGTITSKCHEVMDPTSTTVMSGSLYIIWLRLKKK